MKRDYVTLLPKLYRLKCVYLALIVLTIIPRIAFGQTTLADFETAAASSDVNLIPFRDLRGEATSIADDVQRRKADVDSFKYDVFVKRKNNIFSSIADEKKEIEKIQKDREEYKSKNPGVSTSTFDKDIEKHQENIKEYSEKMEKLNKEMDAPQDAFERLYHARAGLREWFDKALSAVSDARSNPTKILGSSPSKEDVERLEKAADTIKYKINQAEDEHKRQEDKAKKRAEDYKYLQSRDTPI
jgi:chromosome segregation ATPase